MTATPTELMLADLMVMMMDWLKALGLVEWWVFARVTKSATRTVTLLARLTARGCL